MKNILISGYYGFGNIGDEAILSAMIEQIKTKIPDCNIIVTSYNVEETKRLHEVAAIDRMDFNAISQEIENCDLVILGGGGLFQDHNKIEIASLFTQPGWGISSYTIVPLIAKMHNKPVIYYSQGIGPLFSKESRTFVAFVSELADMITVRDKASEDLLKEVGVPSSKIKLSLDPSVGLEMAPAERIKNILIKEGIPSDKEIVCVSVRQWIDKSLEENYKKVLSEALDDFLSNSKFYLLFLPFQNMEGGGEDAKIAKEIIEGMKNKDGCYLLKDSYHPREIAGIISKASLVIGMRYHSIIFSFISKVPFVALSYDPKVKNLADELELGEYCVEIDSISSENISEKITKALTDREKTQKKLESAIKDMRERLEVSSSLVQAFIEGSATSDFKIDIPTKIEKMKLLNTLHSQVQAVISLQRYFRQLTSGLESQLKDKNDELANLQGTMAGLESQLKDKNDEVINLRGTRSDLESQVESKDIEVSQLKEIVSGLESQLKDKTDEVINLRGTRSDLESQVESKDIEVSQLKETVSGLESQLKDKTDEVANLQETLRQRESSLSWRLSQFYGRYFSTDSRLTRFILYFINKIISSPALPSIRHPIIEYPVIESLKSFLNKYGETNLCLFFSGTKFVENEGQRTIRLAQEFSKKGYPVVFASWRWNEQESFEYGEVFSNVFQIPIDVLVKYAKEIFSFSNSKSSIKVFMIEFPHPSLFEILSLANSNGWITIYDVLDNWEAFHKVGQATWYDKDVEGYIVLNSDIITAVSPVLSEKLINDFGCKTVRIIPNAVSLEILRKGQSKSIPNRPKGKITIGYFGHLTPAWFDWDLVISIAIRNPEWVFHIIGYGKPENLELPDNVLFIGKVNPNELSGYSVNWDVAIIPFKDTAVSLSVDPIKIYEYIYLGLPVVATGIYHIDKYPYVWVAQSSKEFEQYINKASTSPIDKNVIRKFISENTWSKRIDYFIKIISEFDYEYSLKNKVIK